MNELLANIGTRVRGLTGALSGGKKLLLAGAAVVVAAILAAVVYFTTRTDFVPFAPANADQGQVASWLKEQNVEFRVEQGDILVPRGEVPSLLMRYANDGGTPTIGYDKLFESQFGMPEDVRGELKHRALEGELGRSIETLDVVRMARVHLAFPKESLFAEDARPPTASVLLNIKTGKEIDERSVRGIANLVAGAVPRLEPEAVKIMDQDGKVLSKNDGIGAAATAALDYQRQTESRLEEKATEMLEKAVGQGNALVRVDVDLDRNQAQWREENYDPEKTAVISEETLSEERSNGGDRVGGAAGAAANDVRAAQGVVRVGDASNGTREKTIVNTVASKTVREVVGPGIQIKRMSVSVMVDGTYKEPVPDPAAQGKAEEGEAQAQEPLPIYVPRSAQEMDQLRGLIAKAVNFNPERGDQLEVANVQFFEEPKIDAEAIVSGERMRQLVDKAIQYGLGILGLLLIVFFVFRPLVRWMTRTPEGVEVLEEGELPPEETLALPGEEDLAELEVQEPSLIEQIQIVVKDRPELAAAVLKFWLSPRSAEGQ